MFDITQYTNNLLYTLSGISTQPIEIDSEDENE